MDKGLESIRTVINKKMELDITDIDIVKNCLEQISPWPWTPKQAINLCTPGDVEFTAKAPELIKRLCNHIEYLYELLGHANRIIDTAGLKE
jgi:hypothetical protein